MAKRNYKILLKNGDCEEMLSKYKSEDGNYSREYLDHWENLLHIIDRDLEAGTGDTEGLILNTFECATSLARYLLEFEKIVIKETTRELNINNVINDNE
tara:strand:- start:71600 stop:71896 length:297 start_codon:yes stop_codon:yes gene_type:complete